MTQRLGYVALVGVVVLGCALLFSRADAEPVSSGAGRFQIVNGTPDQTQNIMLLDSATGESWVNCADADNQRGWCYMPRGKAAAIVRTR